MFTRTALVAATALVLVPAASAHAEGANGQVIQPTVRQAATTMALAQAPSLDALAVTLRCDAVSEQVTPPDTAGTRCTGTLRIEAGKERWYWTGKWGGVGSAPLDVPIGASTVTVPVPGLVPLLQKQPDLYLKATLVRADGETTELSTQDDAAGILSVSMPIASSIACGIPAKYAYRATSRPQQLLKYSVGGESFRQAATAPNAKTLDKRYWHVATSKTTVRVNGISYELSKGSEFAMQCVRSTSSKMQHSAVLYLWHGTARAMGKPTGRQKVTGIQVPPGLFSTSSAERVDLTVTANGNVKTSNLKKIFSTARSTKGTLTAYQRLKIDPSAHCTPGKGIYMRMDGLTKVLN